MLRHYLGRDGRLALNVAPFTRRSQSCLPRELRSSGPPFTGSASFSLQAKIGGSTAANLVALHEAPPVKRVSVLPVGIGRHAPADIPHNLTSGRVSRTSHHNPACAGRAN